MLLRWGCCLLFVCCLLWVVVWFSECFVDFVFRWTSLIVSVYCCLLLVSLVVWFGFLGILGLLFGRFTLVILVVASPFVCLLAILDGFCSLSNLGLG